MVDIPIKILSLGNIQKNEILLSTLLLKPLHRPKNGQTDMAKLTLNPIIRTTVTLKIVCGLCFNALHT